MVDSSYDYLFEFDLSDQLEEPEHGDSCMCFNCQAGRGRGWDQQAEVDWMEENWVDRNGEDPPF